ncbi:MAG: hypothetical protein RLN70_00460 [Rhodospirillaceae bacterium]
MSRNSLYRSKRISRRDLTVAWLLAGAMLASLALFPAPEKDFVADFSGPCDVAYREVPYVS